MPPISPVRRSNNFNNQSTCSDLNICNNNNRNIFNYHLTNELKSMKKYENNITINLSVLIWTIIILILLFFTYILFSLKSN